jgi:hypothetical protein
MKKVVSHRRIANRVPPAAVRGMSDGESPHRSSPFARLTVAVHIYALPKTHRAPSAQLTATARVYSTVLVTSDGEAH